MVDSLETTLLSQTRTQFSLEEVYNMKQKLMCVRRMVWPLRDVISAVDKSDNRLLKGSVSAIYWRDIYDHTIQVSDSLETLRDTVSSLQEVYLSMTSNRLNELMKTLNFITLLIMLPTVCPHIQPHITYSDIYTACCQCILNECWRYSV